MTKLKRTVKFGIFRSSRATQIPNQDDIWHVSADRGSTGDCSTPHLVHRYMGLGTGAPKIGHICMFMHV